MSVVPKDPQAVLDYILDWLTDGYLQSGEEITGTPVWTILPAGALVKDSQSNTITATTITLSGGVAGHLYRVTCQITTDQAGRKDERSIAIRVQEG